jgi:hypothetical protein
MENLKPATQRLRPGSALGGLVCALLLLARAAGGADLHTSNPHEVMAGYLRALPAYVHWPTNTLATPEQPWRIGILGADPFGDVLETTLRDRQAAGRGFDIARALKLKDLPPCEILFIAIKDEDELKKIFDELGSRPVLTVGEHDDFLTLGGIVQLQTRDTVKIFINLDRARAAQLEIPKRMLDVASGVIENGVRRKLKDRPCP